MKKILGSGLKVGMEFKEEIGTYRVEKIQELHYKLFGGRLLITSRHTTTGELWKFHCGKRDPFNILE